MPRQTDGVSFTPQWNFLGTGDTSTVQMYNSLNGTYSLMLTYPLGDLRYQPLNAKLTAIASLANSAGVLTNNGSGVFSYTPAASGTVTSVAALTLGTTGTDLSSSVANGTTTPVITLNVPTASASNRGALSSTDWSAFNSKQSAITFGTGVQSALGNNIGSAGAPVLFNGAGGTPSSITLTNATGTATSLNIGGNAATVTNGVYTTGSQTIGGAKNFTSPVWVQGVTTIQGVKGTGFGYDQTAYPVVQIGATSGNRSIALGYDPSINAGGSFSGNGSEIVVPNNVKFIQPNAGNTDFLPATLTLDNGVVSTPALKLPTGAVAGRFLQTDGSGNASWQSVISGSTFLGTWAASTNTPTLANGTGTSGGFYRVTDAGTVNFGAGNISFTGGEDVQYNGSIWVKVPAPVIAGNALTKTDDTNVTLTLGGSASTSLVNPASITVGWTGTLADARIASSSNWNTAYTNRITSLTTTGSSGAASLSSNTLNIPTYTRSGLGAYGSGDNVSFGTGSFSGDVILTTKLKKSRDFIQESGFGFAPSTYYTSIIGGTGTSAATTNTLAFGVDLSANTSGSFSGDGSEYFWRNAGSFKTPNAANTAFNTLYSWNSSGNVTYGGTLTASNLSGTNTGDNATNTTANTYADGKVENNLTSSSTVAPSKDAVNSALAGKQASLGFTPEDVSNKSTSTSLGTSNTLYPTQNAVKTYVDNAVSTGGLPSGTPTIVLGLGAGTGASYSIEGDNKRGYIIVTTGTTPTTGATIFTATFAGGLTYGTRATTVTSPASPFSATDATKIYSANGPTAFSLVTRTGQALTASEIYSWYYVSDGY